MDKLQTYLKKHTIFYYYALIILFDLNFFFLLNRQTALETEKERAKNIASLPPPPKDPVLELQQPESEPFKSQLKFTRPFTFMFITSSIYELYEFKTDHHFKGLCKNGSLNFFFYCML